jgi:protein-L-isoaspartate O-methyltransferase
MYARASQLKGRDRLRGLIVGHKAAGDEMEIERERFVALNHEAAKPIAIAASNLFPTPPAIAARVVELAELADFHQILEPSAGTGNLLAAVGRTRLSVKAVAVEINQRLADCLRERFVMNVDVWCRDFLGVTNDELGLFDRVVMNPPFDRGSDIKHIRHALECLKPDGRLVAICANGPRQREAFEPIATEWHDLPHGSFREQGTNVNTAIVVIDA